MARAITEAPIGDGRAVWAFDPSVARCCGVETDAKVGPAELAARRAREFGQPGECDWDLEACEAFAAEGREVVVGGVGRARTQHDRRHRHLPELRVAPGDDARIGDSRVLEQDGLDLGRGDVLATADDPVGAAVGDGEASVGVEGPRSPVRSQPSSVRAAAVATGSSEVAVEQGRAIHFDVTDAVSVRGRDPYLDAGEWPAGGVPVSEPLRRSGGP